MTTQISVAFQTLYLACPACGATPGACGSGKCRGEEEDADELALPRMDRNLKEEGVEIESVGGCLPPEEGCMGLTCDCKKYTPAQWGKEAPLMHGTIVDPCSHAICGHCGFQGAVMQREHCASYKQTPQGFFLDVAILLDALPEAQKEPALMEVLRRFLTMCLRGSTSMTREELANTLVEMLPSDDEMTS